MPVPPSECSIINRRPENPHFGRRKSVHQHTLYESFTDNRHSTKGLEFHQGHLTTLSPMKHEHLGLKNLKGSFGSATYNQDRLNAANKQHLTSPSKWPNHRSPVKDNLTRRSLRDPDRHRPDLDLEHQKAYRAELRKEQSRLAAQVRRNREGQCLILLQDALPIAPHVLGPGVDLEKSDVIRIAGQTLFLLNHVCSNLGTAQSPTLRLHSRALHALAFDPSDDRIVYISPTLVKSIGENWSSLIGTPVHQLLQPIASDRQLLTCTTSSRRKPQFSSKLSKTTSCQPDGFVRFRKRCFVEPLPQPISNRIKRKRRLSGRIVSLISQNDGIQLAEPTEKRNNNNKIPELLCQCWTTMTVNPPSELELSEWIDLPDSTKVFEYGDSVKQCLSESDGWDGPPQLTRIQWLLFRPVYLTDGPYSGVLRNGGTECRTVLDARLIIREASGNVQSCFGVETCKGLIGQCFLSLIHLDDVEAFTEMLESVSMGESIKWTSMYRVSGPQQSGSTATTTTSRSRQYRWCRSLLSTKEDYDGWICVHQPAGFGSSVPSACQPSAFKDLSKPAKPIETFSFTTSFNHTIISNPVKPLGMSHDISTSMVLNPRLKCSPITKLEPRKIKRPMIRRRGSMQLNRMWVCRTSDNQAVPQKASMAATSPVFNAPVTSNHQAPVNTSNQSPDPPTLSPSYSSCSFSSFSGKSSISSSSTSNCPSPGDDLADTLPTTTTTTITLPSPTEDELGHVSGLASMIEELFACDELVVNLPEEDDQLLDEAAFLYTGLTPDM